MNFQRQRKSKEKDAKERDAKERDAKERDVDHLFAEGARTFGHLPKKFSKRENLGFPNPAVPPILDKKY